MRDGLDQPGHQQVGIARVERVHRLARAAIGHMQDVDARAHLQQLAREMGGGAGAGGAEAEMRRPRLRLRHEILEVAHRPVGPREQRHRRLGHQRHRHQVAERIIAGVTLQRRQDCDGGGGEQDGVAIPGLHDMLDAERAAGAGPRFHDHALAELSREVVGNEARRHLHRAAGGEGHDEAHRAARPGA
jgi:hypothetical protein